MRKIIVLLFFTTSFFYAQSNSEIAEVYLIKAEQQLKKKELSQALVYFEKAKTLLGDDTTAKAEEIGTTIYFNLQDYKEAKKHAKNYFSLTIEKGSDRYNEVLFLYVEIEEKIEISNKIKAEMLAAELLRIQQENRIDSLTNVWKETANLLSVSADTIYRFDKNGFGVFKNSNGFYGVVDDKGIVIINPDSCTEFKHYDTKIFLLEGGKGRATKIMVYHTSSDKKEVLPSVSEFNPLSTNYGKVMLPRANGLVVTYPNNSMTVLVYDLDSSTFMNSTNLKKYYEYWKDHKVIKKFNKENQIKIDKEYLSFGGDLGGFSAFFSEDGSLYGFISNGGTILKSENYKYIGSLCNGAIEAIKLDGTVVWLNEQGKQLSAPVNKNGVYAGTTILKKVNSKYQFINEKNEIMKNGEVLEDLDTFLSTH